MATSELKRICCQNCLRKLRGGFCDTLQYMLDYLDAKKGETSSRARRKGCGSGPFGGATA